MIDLLTSALLLVGSAFTFLAAAGLVRLPDLFTRMHAATKAGTVGVGALLLAVAVSAVEEPGVGIDVSARAVATVIFVVLTAPVAAHCVARSAHRSGVAPPYEGTVVDERPPDAAESEEESR